MASSLTGPFAAAAWCVVAVAGSLSRENADGQQVLASRCMPAPVQRAEPAAMLLRAAVRATAFGMSKVDAKCAISEVGAIGGAGRDEWTPAKSRRLARACATILSRLRRTMEATRFSSYANVSMVSTRSQKSAAENGLPSGIVQARNPAASAAVADGSSASNASSTCSSCSASAVPGIANEIASADDAPAAAGDCCGRRAMDTSTDSGTLSSDADDNDAAPAVATGAAGGKAMPAGFARAPSPARALPAPQPQHVTTAAVLAAGASSLQL